MADPLLRKKVPRYDPKTDYGYESEHSLESQKKRKTHFGNMMTDRRIWRGNTYCMYRNQKLEAKKAAEEYYQKRLMRARPGPKDEYHKKMAATKQAAVFENNPPVAGRKYGQVQTELFLTELSVRPAEADQSNQTDGMLERPPSPVFIQAKTGLDVPTQILPAQLFLFDLEVLPILEFLNGKVIQLSLLEVIQEEELAEIRAQHRAFQTIKNFERAEQQRLIDEQRRKHEEKETRKKEWKELMRKEQDTSEKLAALAFAKTYLDSLIPNVFQRLKQDGLFLSPIRAELDIGMVPWLAEKLIQALDQQVAINYLVNELVMDALSENQREEETLWRDIVEGKTSSGPAKMPIPTIELLPIITIEPSVENRAPASDNEESHDEA